ncbi:YlmC/YmxH family sporulation protein [Effusibacillus lacus]|uniref:PRC-barrel domain-containing protein n=1 Tax=Effusibacillus lacus TaxID=1348429 RepID=A0A292YQ17_9BACL|nr:YlmC/YmxH family sporulation protein [Effusibacillus lacus]TCS73176.1 YlmC/YmxH family sporulation protein [Effusibacillus lacus]GAX90580.1 hypothetical protein EFBL_2207 [Effusibacillus lacus]
MRLSELVGRMLVDVHNGEKIGTLGHADLWIDTETGKIGYLVLPGNSGLFSFGRKNEEQTVSWDAVQKIGTDMILIDSNAVKS